MYYACLCFDVKNIFLHLLASFLSFYSVLSSFLGLFHFGFCHGHWSIDGLVRCDLLNHCNSGIMRTNLVVSVVLLRKISAVGSNFALNVLEPLHLEGILPWRGAN